MRERSPESLSCLRLSSSGCSQAPNDTSGATLRPPAVERAVSWSRPPPLLLWWSSTDKRLFAKVLFIDPAYPAYVERYIQQLLAMSGRAPTPLAVSVTFAAALADTCSALRKDSARFRQQSRPRISWRQKQGTLRSLSDNSADPFVRDAQAELDQNRNAPEGMRAYWRTIDAPIEPLDDLVPWGEDNDLGGMGRSSSLPNLWMIMPHGVTPMILETFECTIRLA